MTDRPSPDRTERPSAEPPKRRRISAVALVASGLIAGGVLASSFSATAATTDSESATEATECRPHGPRPEPLDETTAAAVEAAVLADPAYDLARIQS